MTDDTGLWTDKFGSTHRVFANGAKLDDAYFNDKGKRKELFKDIFESDKGMQRIGSGFGICFRIHHIFLEDLT